jgi:hypothetical protein
MPCSGLVRRPGLLMRSRPGPAPGLASRHLRACGERAAYCWGLTQKSLPRPASSDVRRVLSTRRRARWNPFCTTRLGIADRQPRCWATSAAGRRVTGGPAIPGDPPAVEEIVAVMRAADNSANGARLRALILILWRAGLRIGEALDLAETDHDPARGAVLVRRSGVCSGPTTNRSSSTDLVTARATSSSAALDLRLGRTTSVGAEATLPLLAR